MSHADIIDFASLVARRRILLHWKSPWEYMGIYFRDILLIRISRGTSNCFQHVFEKNKIKIIMIFLTILNYFSPIKV